jgi:hypothetical protein
MHCIQGSDAHLIHGKGKNLGLGERATEVLLAETSFAALKEVFAANDFTRTRPYRRTDEPFDHVEAARKQGPTIVQSFHESMTRRGGRLHAVLRDVVAFSNTKGGTIYLGVSPNRKVAPKGLDNVDEEIKTLKTEIGRLVTPPVEAEFSRLKSHGRDIIRMAVPKGNEIPYVLEGSKIYLRQEAETALAMRDEIVDLITQAMPPATKPAPKTQAQARPAPSRAGTSEATAQETKSAPDRTPSARDDGLVEPPRTGVQIVESEERNGVIHHTMRDLRNGNEVHNVTRSSARRLWRYAIALKEKGTFSEEKVNWKEGLGLWHKYLRAGRPHYDLVQKTANADVHIYYGVSEEGIHGAWRAMVGMED